MQMCLEAVEHVRVLKLRSYVMDASNAAELVSRFPGDISGARQVILDLGQVFEIDSDGMNALCACWRYAQTKGVTLTLCGLPPRSRLAARLLRLDTVLPLFEDLNEALLHHDLRIPAADRPELAVS